MVDVQGSNITTTIGLSEVTDVHAPDLGPNNGVYTSTLDGGGPLVEGGSTEPFHFEIRYSRTSKDTVQIHAALSESKPIFYLLLPQIIRDVDGLKRYMGSDYVNTIEKLVEFDFASLQKSTSPGDKMLYEYYRMNKLDKGRGIVRVPSDGRKAEIIFDLHSSDITLQNLVAGGNACIGSGEEIISCF